MIAVSAEGSVAVRSTGDRWFIVKAGLITAFLIALAAPALAQQPPTAPPAQPARRLQARVRELSRRQSDERRRRPQTLRQMTPEAILNAMTLGRMQIQAISLSEAEQRAVCGVSASGKPFGPVRAAGRREQVHGDTRDARSRPRAVSGTAGAATSPTRAIRRTAGSPPPTCRS